MGRKSRSSTSPPPLDEKKSPEGSENVVVEVIEAQARVEDSQERNEDPAFEDVEITLTPVELGKDYQRTTNKEGKAIFQDVPIGEYVVTAKKDGFKFQQIAITKEELKSPGRKVSANGHINITNINAVRKVISKLSSKFSHLSKGERQLDAENDVKGLRDLADLSKRDQGRRERKREEPPTTGRQVQPPP